MGSASKLLAPFRKRTLALGVAPGSVCFFERSASIWGRFGFVPGSLFARFGGRRAAPTKKGRPSRNTAPVQRNRPWTSCERPLIRSEIAAGASCETLCEKVTRKSGPEPSQGRLGIDSGAFGMLRERLGRPRGSSEAPLDAFREHPGSSLISLKRPGASPKRLWVHFAWI